MPPSAERNCLIVLGMHRSGSSALTGAFHKSGLDVGKTLMKAHEDNPKGYFENEALYLLNEQILNDLYSKWYDTLLIPDNWWKSEKFADHKRRLSGILQDQYKEDSDIIIKDPRISVLLPFYIEVIKASNIRPVFLVSHRNPLEISMSLSRRDRFPREKNLLLCMDYLLKTEYYSREFPRLFVSYDDFLENPLAILEHAGKALGLSLLMDEQSTSDILAFLDKSLKHHNHEKIELLEQDLPELAELDRLLRTANRRDLSKKEIQVIDGIRNRFLCKVRAYHGIAENYKARIAVSYEQEAGKSFDFDVVYGYNRFAVALAGLKNISRIVFRPANTSTGIQMLHITATDENGDPVKVSGIITNAQYESSNGIWIFETEIPQAWVEFDPARNLKELTIEMNSFSFGQKAFRMLSDYRKKIVVDLSEALRRERERKSPHEARMLELTDERNRMAEKLNRMEEEWRLMVEDIKRVEKEKKKIKLDLYNKTTALFQSEKLNQQLNQENNIKAKVIAAKERELESVYNSLTWKAGKLLTSPFRMTYNAFKKKP